MRKESLINFAVLFGVVGLAGYVLFPTGTRPRESARRASCQSNLKQIGMSCRQYIQDYDERFPLAKNSTSGLTASDNWVGEIQPYLKSTQIMQCVSDRGARDATKSSYAYNVLLNSAEASKLKNTALIILNYEVAADGDGLTQTGAAASAVSASTRHLTGSNFSFADGHVRWYKPDRITTSKNNKKLPTFAVR